MEKFDVLEVYCLMLYAQSVVYTAMVQSTLQYISIVLMHTQI